MKGSPANALCFQSVYWNEQLISSCEAMCRRVCLTPQWSSKAADPIRDCPGSELSGEHQPLFDLAKIFNDLPLVMK